MPRRTYFVIMTGIIATLLIIILFALSSPHTQPQQYYFALDNATIDNEAQITVYLRAINVDNTRSFNITTVYVDGSPDVSLTPPFGIISTTMVQKFIITGIGVNWTDGNIHPIRFYSSDGYVYTFTISGK